MLRDLDLVFSQRPAFTIDVSVLTVAFIVRFAVASWQEENIYRGYLHPTL